MLKDQYDEMMEALPNRTPEFYAGFSVGVQTARMLVATMPAAIIAKIEI
jgi:hypothetical protein